MSSKAILITGACGLVGAPLSKLLTKRGDHVIGLDPAELHHELDRFTHIRDGFGDYDMFAGATKRHLCRNVFLAVIQRFV